MTLKPEPSKFVDFRLLEGPRQEQEAQRPPKGSHEGAPNGAKMVSKRVFKYGLYPNGGPSGSDGLRRVLFESIWGSFFRDFKCFFFMVSGWMFIVFSCSYLVCIFLFFSDGHRKRGYTLKKGMSY